MVLDDQRLAQLKDYIKRCTDKGLEKQKIIDSLLKSGWSFDNINEAFEPEVDEVKVSAASFQIEDIMNPDIISLQVDSTIWDAIKILRETDEGYVLIMDRDEPKGIITGKDILKNINNEGMINVQATCEKIMTFPLYFVDASEKIFNVCEKMKLNDIERIPVMKKGKLVGIIDTDSLINMMSYD